MPFFSLPVTTVGDSNVDANQLIELIDDRTASIRDEAAILDPEYWPCEDLDGIPEDDSVCGPIQLIIGKANIPQDRGW